jgi:hypothetical protein
VQPVDRPYRAEDEPVEVARLDEGHLEQRQVVARQQELSQRLALPPRLDQQSRQRVGIH